jgi:dethiobiotin synthetase
MSGFFVTATGTDIGKTYVTCGLIAHCRARKVKVEAYKPIISGFDPDAPQGSDTALLLDALGRKATAKAIAALSPWRFKAALSPDMAAAREDSAIDFDELVTFSQAALTRTPKAMTLIEGVGGVMVPLDEEHTVLDWMEALRIPIVLVTGTYLGAISHTLTALDVVASRGIEIAALVVSETAGSSVGLHDTAGTMMRHCAGTPFVLLPRSDNNAMCFTRLAALLVD